MKLFKSIFLLLALIGLFSSCASKKDILYLQDIESLDSLSNAKSYETVIQPNDILSIIVSAQNPETTKPFNLTSASELRGGTANTSYLIDKDGTFDFPVLGKIETNEKSTITLAQELKLKLKDYIVNPVVTVRIENFKVTILGEVENPGTFQINNERITVLEALGLAGDLTIYGKRNDVLILREKDGIKEYKKIDLTSSDFISSNYYYLKQNDVVIVSQNYYEVQRSASNPNNRLYISLASLAISIVVLLTR